MSQPTRRQFTGQLLGSLMAYGLIESAFAQNLFADSVKPIVGQWLTDLANLSRDLHGHKLKDVEFQAKMEELYRRVDLPELIKQIQLDKLAATTNLPDNGAASLGFDLARIDGAPARPGFGKQIFGLKKGRSVVPHGHSNMCTGFIVLRGDFTGRHYDKLETHGDHYVIKPTIDRKFKPGELSTISDHKDNIHWFKCESDTGFIFNVHVTGYDPAITDATGRLYLDPDGEKLAGGLVKAPKMTSAACHKKYG
jgi:hypothetical protein